MILILLITEFLHLKMNCSLQIKILDATIIGIFIQ